MEFFRTLAGAFAGAGAAFMANLHLQKRAKRLDEVAAGNHAMATLSRQFNEYIGARNGINAEVARCQAEAAMPSWFNVRPFMHSLDASLEIDFKSITFLFEEPNTEAFTQLHVAQALYRDLIANIDRLTEACIEKQKRFEEAGYIGPQPMAIDADVAWRTAGPRLVMRIEIVLGELQRHAAKDTEQYLSAAAALHAALSSRFRGRFRVLRLVGEEEPSH